MFSFIPIIQQAKTGELRNIKGKTLSIWWQEEAFEVGLIYLQLIHCDWELAVTNILFNDIGIFHDKGTAIQKHGSQAEYYREVPLIRRFHDFLKRRVKMQLSFSVTSETWSPYHHNSVDSGTLKLYYW